MTRRRDIEGLLRDAAPRVLAAVARRFGDFADARDATQEALLAATQQWPRQGRPKNLTMKAARVNERLSTTT